MGPVLGSHGSSACICAQTRAQESTPAHMSPVSYSESKSKSKTEDVNGRSPPREAFTPEPAEAAAVHTDLPGRETTFFRQKRPDYQRIGRLPPISSYEQLQEQRYDPVLLAMALTGGSEKEDWGFWVKKLNKGRKELGDDQAERMFRNCLDTVFGEMKQNELVKPPGARLNVLLKEAFD